MNVRPAPARAPVVAITIGIVMFVMIGVVTGLLSSRRRAKSVQPPVGVPRVADTTGRPVFTPPPKTWGSVETITLDEQGDVVASFGDQLVKADGRTLALRWAAPLASGRASMRRMLVPRGDRLVLVLDDEVQFFDAATGAKTGAYKYKSGGILQGACGAGKSEVLVKVLGPGLMRFDAATGTKSSGTATCNLNEELRCGTGQSCGWARFKTATLDCRYQLRASKDVFRDCDTDDGSGRHVLVRMAANGTPAWQVEGGSVNAFMGIVDGVLVVAERSRVVAYDPSSGKTLWTRNFEGSGGVTADANRVFHGVSGTIAVVEAQSGREVARLPGPT